jgi:hypothetical protein
VISPARIVFALVLAIVAAGAESGESRPEREFRGRVWSLELPASYSEHSSATPASDVFMIGFAPAMRDDGTRALIQVTLVEMPLNMDPAKFIKMLREQLIAGVQRRRENFQVKASESTVGDVAVTRYEWSGVVIPAADGAARSVPARGVMLIGVHEGVGFALHAQDIDEHADATLSESEPSMRTFIIRRPAAK